MHVAVAIVGFRNPGDIADCLVALARSTHRDFSVVICENGGREAFGQLRGMVPEYLSAGQPVRLIEASHNLGYAGGVNVCIAEAPAADAFWVLNPDTVPEAEAMENLLKRLVDGGYGIVGGRLINADGRVQAYGGRWRRWLARAVSLGKGADAGATPDIAAIEAQTNYVLGACMMLSRAYVEKTGPMRDEYFLYCEEVEWCLRGIAAGHRMGYAHDAVVRHAQGTTTGAASDPARKSRLSVYLEERNRLLVTRDIYPAWMPVVAFNALLLLCLRYGRARAWTNLRHALAGWRAGLLDERGSPDWLPH